MFTIENIGTLYGVLTVALLFFTLIVASTKTYRTRRRFWLAVVGAWIVAYVVASMLFLLLRMDTIFTLMVSSLAGYLVMGDLPFRKKAVDEDFEKLEMPHEKESAN